MAAARPFARPRLVMAVEPVSVSVEHAAALLGVSPRSVETWIADGELAVVRLPGTRGDGEPSRRVLVALADLRAFVAKHRDGAR